MFAFFSKCRQIKNVAEKIFSNGSSFSGAKFKMVIWYRWVPAIAKLNFYNFWHQCLHLVTVLAVAGISCTYCGDSACSCWHQLYQLLCQLLKLLVFIGANVVTAQSGVDTDKCQQLHPMPHSHLTQLLTYCRIAIDFLKTHQKNTEIVSSPIFVHI